MTVEMENQNSLEDTTVPESFPPLSTPVTTTADDAPGKSSYANVTGKPSGKKLNFRTLYTPGKVAYLVVANYVRNTWGKYGLVRSMFSSSTGLFSFQFSSIDGLDATLKNGSWFNRNNPLILKKWHPDKNLMNEDISTVPIWVKLHGVPVKAFSENGLSAIVTKLGTPLMLDSYTSDMCMQSWGRSSYARAMIERRADLELKDNIVVAMPKLTREAHYICVGEKKTMKKPSQTSRGVPVGPKNRCVPTIEVSNSNPFEVLNSVDNDVELGTNEGTTNLVNNEATSSGSSFMNVDNSSTGTTPIIDKIRKFEELLTSGKATLVDEAGNPLKKVEYPDDYDSEYEVASVDNDMARSMASKRVGFGTQSLLKQWRDSYGNGDFDEDPYDDDMYEGQDLSQELQAICDNLDIRVRGRKKK
ncbi:copia protein [Tanacetum coccineum]